MEPHEELTKTEARGGDSRKMNGVVLAISLAAIIVLFLALILIYR